MDRVVKRIFIILLLALLTSGCATTRRMYEGEPLPKEQVAIIKGSTYFYFVATVSYGLVTVDYEDLGVLTPKSVEVLPGWHDIYVGHTTDGPFMAYTTHYRLKFLAMAGHEYRVTNCPHTGVCVVDTRSGEIVASQPR